MKKTALAVLIVALGPMLQARPEAGLRAKGRPQLYDRAADRSAGLAFAALTSVQDWWPPQGDLQRISFFRLSPERLRIKREGLQDLAPIWGSVMILGGEYVTLRFREEQNCPPVDHHTHTVMETGFGIPLARNRVYFVAGKAPTPDELLFEFSTDPFLNESGAVTVKRVRESRYSDIRTTFHTTHMGGDSTGVAEVEFRAELPKMALSGPLSGDAGPVLYDRTIRRYASEPQRLHHWSW